MPTLFELLDQYKVSEIMRSLSRVVLASGEALQAQIKEIID